MVAAADGGEERRSPAISQPNRDFTDGPVASHVAPAWSPDGRLIVVAAATLTSGGRGRVLFVDSENGSLATSRCPAARRADSVGSIPESLVLNQPPQFGSPNQLFRLPYPAGQLSRLTNDPNDYIGVSLTGDGRALVTARQDVRIDVWVGDAGGTTGTEAVRRAPVEGSVPRVSHGPASVAVRTVVSGRAAILRVTPGQDTSEEVVVDALTPGVTSDGRTIVFVSSSTDLGLWTADANGRRVARLVPSVTA